MKRKIVFFCALLFASVLALCWHPLLMISKTHLVDTQILFYAFSSSALLTVPVLFKQAKHWRPHVPLLVLYAVVSSAAFTTLQYLLLEGVSLTVISILCITLSCLLLFSKAGAGMGLDFLVTLLVLIAAIMVLFIISGGLQNHWTEWSAVFVGILLYALLNIDRQSNVIPLGSKLSVSLVGSTWLIGMITIFSERFSSYIQDNAVGFSVIYGSLFLLPIIGSVLYILSSKNISVILIWLALLLVVSIADVIISSEIASVTLVAWPLACVGSAMLLELIKTFLGSSGQEK